MYKNLGGISMIKNFEDIFHLMICERVEEIEVDLFSNSNELIKFDNELDHLMVEIKNLLVEDKKQLMGDLECKIGDLINILERMIYKQGLKDGVKLRQIMQ